MTPHPAFLKIQLYGLNLIIHPIYIPKPLSFGMVAGGIQCQQTTLVYKNLSASWRSF